MTSVQNEKWEKLHKEKVGKITPGYVAVSHMKKAAAGMNNVMTARAK